MKNQMLTIKDKMFLFLFLIGWSTISYSVLKLLGGSVVESLEFVKHEVQSVLVS